MDANQNAQDDAIEAAVSLALDVAPDLDAILLTLYPDAETLDTLRPGDADLATANAVTRAVAGVMAEEGVALFVQRADRGAFRRWLAAQPEDTPSLRRAWVDRGRLLQGAEACKVLGLAPPEAEPPPNFPPAPGPVADELLAAYAERENGEFDDLAGALIEAGRGDVLDLALRKVAAAQSDENAANLRFDLLALAEGSEVGPSGWAELVALPVALPPGAVPEAPVLAEALISSGGLAPEEELRFLPGWRDPEAIAALSPLATRRVLQDLLAGREPRDLPPGDTDDLAAEGFGVLVGLCLDWSLPVWEVLEAEGGLPAEEETETPKARGRVKALERWRSRVAAEHPGCVPLDLGPLAAVADTIGTFLDLAGSHVVGLGEIQDFVATGRREAAGEEVVCRPEILGDGLQLTLYTIGGRFLDNLSLPAERLPAAAEAMPGVLASFVRVVKDAPG